jgi:hypothetical protein
LDITRILAELKEQRRGLDEAIAALESIVPRPQPRGKSTGKQMRRATNRQQQARHIGRSALGRPTADSEKVIPFRLLRSRARTRKLKRRVENERA